MSVSKRAAQVAIQIIICMTIIIPVIAMLTGCTIVINSENVTTATEATNAVLGGI
ncbi:putative i-spanin [Aeromonas phage JELG-KS1]|uniref:I-spanin n=1 Tax=Aeromonas phage JELG-KS1 TaxID=2951233 RepID=A0A9E7NP95_9CAUD|nr:putative i-spanin [Aeromonas phage JELG-KS1]